MTSADAKNQPDIATWRILVPLVVTADSEEIAFERTGGWIRDLDNVIRQLKGTRYIKSVSADLYSASHGVRKVREHQGSDEQILWRSEAVFEVVGPTRETAQTRFLNALEFLQITVLRRELDPEVVFAVEDITEIQGPYLFSADSELLTLFHPNSIYWSDGINDGAWDETDIDDYQKFCLQELLWLTTDENTEALRAIEFVVELLSRVEHDVYFWKWVVVGVHNAVQAAMVLALKGTWNIRVMDECIARPVLEAHAKGDRHVFPKDPKLAKFLTLYKWIKNDERMRIYVHSRSFKPSGTQTKSIKWLNRTRNQFVHYVPMTSIWELLEFPNRIQDCLHVVRFLLEESNNIIWHDERDGTKARQALAQAIQATERLAKHYADLSKSFSESTKIG